MVLQHKTAVIQLLLIKCLLCKTLIFAQIPIDVPKTWTYEIVDYQVYVENPEIMESEINITRISRGNFGLTGYLDLKVDLYDDTIGEAYLERSSGDIYGPFYKTPFQILNVTLTEALNTFYKDLMMESLSECSNAPFFETFKPPLAKSYMKFENCQYKIDNLPNHMAEGFYRLVAKVHGPTEAANIVLFQIMNID